MVTWQDHPLAMPGAEWPYNIGEAVRAVHFSRDRDCPYSFPQNCPNETQAEWYITSYKEWLKHRGVDVDELLASRSVSSTEVGR